MGVETRLTKRDGKVFNIRYTDASGRWVREKLGSAAAGWTEAKARRVLWQRRGEVERGYQSPKHLSFRGLADSWLREEAIRKDWAWRTLQRYKSSIRHLEPLHQLPVGKVRAPLLEAWAADALETYAAKTVYDDISVLHSIFAYAVRRELIQKNPAEKLPRPKVGKRNWRILSPQEIQKVDGCFQDEESRLLFRVLTRTGLRRGEALGLTWADIDFERNLLHVRVSKTEEGQRAVAIPPSLAADLKQRAGAPAEHIFYPGKARYGGGSAGGRYTVAFKLALRMAGITDYVRPFHDMRHSSLTNSAVLGADPLALMTKAGHRSFTTTQHYLKLAGIVFPDEAERLERRLSETSSDSQ